MANRGMSASMLTEIAKSSNITTLLVEIGFDSGTIYRTTAGVDISHGGNSYLRSHVLSISNVTESIEQRVGSIQLQVTGVLLANISSALSEDWIDRTVVIKRALLNQSTLAVIADPVEIFNGNITNHPDIHEDSDNRTATITWQAASHWADFERITGRRTNHEDQQVYFSGDNGLEFASEIIKEIPWGRAN